MNDYTVDDINNLTNIGSKILDELQTDFNDLETDINNKNQIIDNIKKLIIGGEKNV